MEAADRLLSRIDELAPQLKPRAAEFEAARRIPRDVIETLRAVGVFRMVVPQSHGGLEMDMPGVVRVFSALGRIDGSLGWTIGIGSVSAVFATLLPRTTYDRVYSASPDIIIAGSNLPLGEATPTEDGWRIHGRWPFVTGCQHADWILARCVVKENGAGPIVEGATHPAPPIHRSFMLPAREWQIDETWDVAGLKGTGSHHVAFGDRLVENGHLYDPVGGKPCVSGPLYQAITPLLSVAHGAVCVGIAQGALDDIVELARTGRQQFRAPTPMRDSEIFQQELGRIEANLRAAHAALSAQTESNWRHALAGTLKDDKLLIKCTQNAIWVAHTCVQVADACFALGGAEAIHDRSPLQRRLRDLHVAAQHAASQQRGYAAAGKLLLE